MSIIQSWIQTSDQFYRISSPQVNLNMRTFIGSNLYDAKYRKRVIIDSGVIIGSNSTAVAALQIPSALGGDLIIDNYGSIQGAGGPAGNTGGDAILAQASCKINNKSGGTIYGGGGGGGTGGTGGTGGNGNFQQTVGTGGGRGCVSDCTTSCTSSSNPGTFCRSQCVFRSDVCYPFDPGFYQCFDCARTDTIPTTGGAGGAGGAGGRGRGYDGALAAGSGGSAGFAGGTNAGTGGTGGAGGTGGDWGQSGAPGNTGLPGSNGNASNGLAGSGGGGGGAAGYYINGLSTYVTLTNNGTIAGRSN